MDGWSSGRQVNLAIVASVGLVTVLCVCLVLALLIVGVGDRIRGGERAVDVVDRIAYVGTDDNLYLIDRQGENLEYLAVGGEGIALTFPTWSPDGRRVAFIARRGGSEGAESILYTVSTVGGDPTTLYASQESLAFYLYWSPDSRYVSFLTQEDSGLALRLALADASQAVRILLRGTPFYWSWSPDGQEMFMHIGGARRNREDAHLALLSSQPESIPLMFEDAPAAFQAPAWSPDGTRLLYAGQDESGESALYVRQRESGTVEKLTGVFGFVGFNWSPDGRWIAYHQIDDPTSAPLGHVYLLSSGGSERRQVSRDPALAFFWSPDGKHLAILAPSLGKEQPSARNGLAAPLQQEQVLWLRWWLMDIPDGELRPLAAFRPTRSFLSILPYFDQYAQSIRFWSPDSRYLLYSDQESPQQAGIWVVDVQGRESPRRLADGTLAVWSWR